MKERITIILLTKNGERYLEEVMEGIFAQRVALPFEVLAIDSGSRDRSKEILNRYPVRLVEIPPMSSITGRLVIWEPGWLIRIRVIWFIYLRMQPRPMRSG